MSFTLQIHFPSVILRNIALHNVRSRNSRQGPHFHPNTMSLPPYSVQWIWYSVNQSYLDIDIWCQAKTAIALHFQRRCMLCLRIHLLQGPGLHLMLSQGFSCRFYYTPGNPAQVTLFPWVSGWHQPKVQNDVLGAQAHFSTIQQTFSSSSDPKKLTCSILKYLLLKKKLGGNDASKLVLV